MNNIYRYFEIFYFKRLCNNEFSYKKKLFVLNLNFVMGIGKNRFRCRKKLFVLFIKLSLHSYQ